MSHCSAHTVHPYKPDGGFDPSGLVLLGIGLSAVSVILGGVATWISHYVYLIILFPLGMGLALAAVGSLIVKSAKIRNVPLAIVMAVIAADITVATMHVASFIEFKKAFADLDAPSKQLVESSEEEQKKVLEQISPEDRIQVEHFLNGYKAKDNFINFLNIVASEGVSIQRTGRSGKGINLGFVGTYLYWGVEWLIITLMAVFGIKAAAAAPYCKRCHTWKKSQGIVTWGGDTESAKRSFDSGRLDEVESLIDKSQTSVNSSTSNAEAVSVEFYSCPKCNTMNSIDASLSKLTRNRKGQIKAKQLSFLCFAGNALTDFQNLRQKCEQVSASSQMEKKS